MLRDQRKSIFFLFLIMMYTYFVYGTYVPYTISQFFIAFPLGGIGIGESLRAFLIISLSSFCILKLLPEKRKNNKEVLFVPFAAVFYMLFLHTMKLLIGVNNPFSVMLPLLGRIAIEYLCMVIAIGAFYKLLVFKQKLVFL